MSDPTVVALRHRPCGECHLSPGEKCDICGAREPVSLKSNIFVNLLILVERVAALYLIGVAAYIFFMSEDFWWYVGFIGAALLTLVIVTWVTQYRGGGER